MPSRSESVLSFRGAPGEYISQGGSHHFDPTNAIFRLELLSDRTVCIRVEAKDGHDYWSIQFSIPQGKTLRRARYSAATRCAFNPPETPGFNLSGCGRCSNSLYASFTIRGVRFSKDYTTLEFFSAVFEQRSERRDAPALKGEVRYVSPRLEKGRKVSSKVNEST